MKKKESGYFSENWLRNEFVKEKINQEIKFMDKTYKCKKCGEILEYKEIDIDLEFQKSIRKISNRENVTDIPLKGTHKGCGGEVIVTKN